MEKPKHHILVCASFRAAGEAKGVCHRKDSTSLIGYLQSELADRDMNDVVVSMTGCLNLCERGPMMIVYPEAQWYGEVDEGKVDEILDALEQGKAAEGLLC